MSIEAKQIRIPIFSLASAKYPKAAKISRYVFSGGTAAAVDLALLFACTNLLHIWYLASAIIAFIVAFGVSFTMQKYWTFMDASRDRTRLQAVQYFAVACANLAVNTLLVFLFVHYAGWHYMIAQVVASILIAVESYFIYGCIFRSRSAPKSI